MINPAFFAAVTLLACQPGAKPAEPKPESKPAAPAAKQPEKSSEKAKSADPVMTFEGDLFESREGAIVASGLTFTEGPLYRADGSVIICDLGGDAVFSFDSTDGKTDRTPDDGVKTLRKPSGKAAGSALDREGRLIFAQFDGKVTRLDKDGQSVTLASELDGKKLNLPNDLVLRADGSIYFTDFGAGRDEAHLNHCGVYRIAPDGKLQLLDKAVESPNGLAFSHDEKTLYVALYRKATLMAFDVAENGSLSNGRVFAELKDPAIKGPSSPDGLKVDLKGNVWTTGAGGVWIFSPQGKRLGRVLVSSGGLSNLCFGGADGKTVFFTGGSRVFSAKLKDAAIKPVEKAADKPAVKPAAPAKS